MNMKTSRYIVAITNDGFIQRKVEGVLTYENQHGLIYIAGTDFEQWICLKPGDTLTVTEYD